MKIVRLLSSKAAREVSEQHVIVVRFKNWRGAERFMHYLENVPRFIERVEPVCTK